jgi:hypothetical protein
MKNYINSSKITLISSLITAIAAVAILVMPGMAMAGYGSYGNGNGNGNYTIGHNNNNGGNGGHNSGSSYYYNHNNASYYPVTHSAPVVVNTTPTVININNNTEPEYYSQPIVYDQPVMYSQPIVYSTPTYAYAPSYTPSYAPTYYQDYNVTTPIEVSCSANASFAPVGTMVLWTASVSGGSGYYTYAWSGSDQIYGSLSSADVSYNTSGQKYAAVSVYSNGQTVTVNCSNIVTVGVPTYTNGNPPVTTNTVVKQDNHPVTRTVYIHDNASTNVSSGKNINTNDNAGNPNGLSANSLFSLSNIPWGWVAVLIILVLFGTVLYLLFNKHKI